jgi:hypothetical protein
MYSHSPSITPLAQSPFRSSKSLRTSRNNYFAPIQSLRPRVPKMLQMPQRALDSTKDSCHRTTCVFHVIALFITAFGLGEIGLETENLV